MTNNILEPTRTPSNSAPAQRRVPISSSPECRVASRKKASKAIIQNRSLTINAVVNVRSMEGIVSAPSRIPADHLREEGLVAHRTGLPQSSAGGSVLQNRGPRFGHFSVTEDITPELVIMAVCATIDDLPPGGAARRRPRTTVAGLAAIGKYSPLAGTAPNSFEAHLLGTARTAHHQRKPHHAIIGDK